METKFDRTSLHSNLSNERLQTLTDTITWIHCGAEWRAAADKQTCVNAYINWRTWKDSSQNWFMEDIYIGSYRLTYLPIFVLRSWHYLNGGHPYRAAYLLNFDSCSLNNIRMHVYRSTLCIISQDRLPSIKQWCTSTGNIPEGERSAVLPTLRRRNVAPPSRCIQ